MQTAASGGARAASAVRKRSWAAYVYGGRLTGLALLIRRARSNVLWDDSGAYLVHGACLVGQQREGMHARVSMSTVY